VAIKVNLLAREEAAPARRTGMSFSLPKLAVGGGLVVQIATGVLVLLILTLGGLAYRAWSAKGAHAKEITELKARNEALKSQLTELRIAEEAKRDLQRRIDIIGRVAKSQGVPISIMNGVLKAVPRGVWLTSLEMKPQEARVRVDQKSGPTASAASETLQRLEGKRDEAGAPPRGHAGQAQGREVVVLQGFGLVLKGVAFSNLQIADLMDNLRKVGVFSDVDFTVTQADRVEQTRVMDFEVTAQVKL
jgi:Tfp pilus assembly protein PilN